MKSRNRINISAKLAVFSILLTLFACGSDDSSTSSDPLTQASLTGTWKSDCFERNSLAHVITGTFTESGAYTITTMSYPTSTECAEAGLLFTVSEDGSYALGDHLGEGVIPNGKCL